LLKERKSEKMAKEKRKGKRKTEAFLLFSYRIFDEGLVGAQFRASESRYPLQKQHCSAGEVALENHQHGHVRLRKTS
jgi:hypothetical protein